MQETYKFNKNDFDEQGFKVDGKYFLDLIKECEVDFHKQFSPLHATHFFANYSTMILIKKSLPCETNEDYGMDSEFDFETNFKMDNGERRTIYGLGNYYDEDSPLWLMKDDKMNDDIFILKHIPDNDDENIEPKNPVENKKTKKKIILTRK